jgi:hypothetical protein
MSLNLKLDKGNAPERDRVEQFARVSASDMISATIFGSMKKLFRSFPQPNVPPSKDQD